MNRRHTVAMVGGAATLFATAPLTLIFAGLFAWFIPIVLVTAIVVGAGMGLRALRAPLAVVALGQLLGVLLFVTWTNVGGTVAGIVPTGQTVQNFGRLFGEALKDANDQVVPVPDSSSLVFVAVIGAGLVALLVDLFAMGLRTPALAGLPLLVLYVVPMAVMETSLPWLIFIPGAMGYLWLLLTDNIQRVRRFGRRFTGDGRNIDVWEPSPLASTGRWLTAIGIALALLFPLIVPGVNTSGLLDAFGSGGNGTGEGSGPGEGAVTLDVMANLRGSLDRDETVDLFQLITTDPRPGYLRLSVADLLTPEGMAPSDPSEQEFPAVDGIIGPTLSPLLTGEQYTAQITMAGMRDSRVPIYNNTGPMEIGRSWLYDPMTGTIRSKSRNTTGLTYKFTYTRYDYKADLLRQAAAVDQGTDLYTRNTGVDHLDSVDALARSLTKDAATEYDKAMAVNNYFSAKNGFTYQLKTETGASPSAVEDFLANKKGFCEQYAATMVYLLRSVGIPSRAVLGFTPGSGASNTRMVNNFNAHAWVEVYFQGFGWVPFDPTPSTNVQSAVEFPWAPDPNQADEPTPDGSGAGPDQPDKGNPGASADPNNTHDLNPNDYLMGVDAAARKPLNPWPWVGGALAVALVLSLPSLARGGRRRRRLGGGGDGTDAAHLAWIELQDTLADYDFSGAPSETPRGTADRLIQRPKLTGAAADGIRALATAEEHARYAAGGPGSGPDLAAALKAVRSELAEYTGRVRRLWVVLAPPSVLRSWRQGLARTVARTVNAGSRLRNRLTRPLRSRRTRGENHGRA